MHQEQRAQTRDRLSQRGIDQALFAHPQTITWLTGFAPPIQLGPNLFAGGPSLLWYAAGRYTLIVLDAHAGMVGDLAAADDCDVRAYAGYTIEASIESTSHQQATLAQLLGESKAAAAAGIEMAALPVGLSSVLRTAGVTDWTPIDGWLTDLRMVKTEEELALLRRNFALTEVGHAAARRAVRPGQREIDVWTDIHAAIQREAGQRVPLGNDCTVGTRQANIGGWPQDETLGKQDSIIIDLSTVLGGYWSDSCVTYCAGEPTTIQRKLHTVVSSALDYAIGLVRPGVAAKEIDARVRAFIADAGYPVYPHHTGHGVGVSGHEEPRIVPYNEQLLEEGMVILLEPGIYLPGETGVRLEDAMLVTADGAQLLTHYDKSLTRGEDLLNT